MGAGLAAGAPQRAAESRLGERPRSFGGGLAALRGLAGLGGKASEGLLGEQLEVGVGGDERGAQVVRDRAQLRLQLALLGAQRVDLAGAGLDRGDEDPDDRTADREHDAGEPQRRQYLRVAVARQRPGERCDRGGKHHRQTTLPASRDQRESLPAGGRAAGCAKAGSGA